MKTKLNFSAILFIAFLWNLQMQAQSAYCTKILDYFPAPGQYTNKNYPKYEVGNTQDSLNKKALKNLQTSGGLISLGAYGGYVIFGFDHPIANSYGHYDFKVYGNAFTGNGEPGIIMVSRDVNGNGLPDDPWYEIKGSAYDLCTKNYEITYTKPAEDATKVPWADNLGRSGEMPGQFPKWRSEESITFKGTLFEDSLHNKIGQWGYADNVPNADEYSKVKITWAIEALGNPANLPSVDFVKVYTGMNKHLGVIGEVSTEIGFPGIEDLHPKMQLYAENNTLNPNKEYHVLNLTGILSQPNSVWEETLQYDEDLDETGYGTNEKTFEKTPFIFHYSTMWDGLSWEGFTYTNQTDILDKSISTNQFSAITGGGVDGKDSTYLTAYFSEMTSQMLDYGINNNHYISFDNNNSYRVAGTYITNTTVAYHSMLEGDAFAKKFGGNNGTDKDWFKVTFMGIGSEGDTTGTVDFYLADFRSDNAEDHYIVNNWRWVDLSSLGKVSKIYYTMSTSDMGSYGYMNTPAYFCMDKLAVETINTNNLLSWIKVDNQPHDGFNAETNNYSIEVPSGTTQVPNITAEVVSPYAILDIASAQTLNDTTFITVTAENGDIRLYSVSFTVKPANANNHLAWIKVNDSLLSVFSKETFYYEILVPANSTEIPAITYQTEDERATTDIVNAKTLSDTTFITITAENGNIQIYSLFFKGEEPNSIAQPSSLTFSVYPNPVKETLYIEGYTSLKSLALYNEKGQLVKIFPANSSSLNLSDISQGIYFLRICDNDGNIVNKKLLKK